MPRRFISAAYSQSPAVMNGEHVVGIHSISGLIAFEIHSTSSATAAGDRRRCVLPNVEWLHQRQ